MHSCLEDGQSAEHVDVDRPARIGACVVEVGHCRAVEDSVNPVHGRGECFGVADVTDHLTCR